MALDFGVLDDETEAASRTIADWPAGTARTAEVVAGGWPHTLGADAPTALASVAFAVLASAAVPPRTTDAGSDDGRARHDAEG